LAFSQPETAVVAGSVAPPTVAGVIVGGRTPFVIAPKGIPSAAETIMGAALPGLGMVVADPCAWALKPAKQLQIKAVA
jgi:hypothetical protein